MLVKIAWRNIWRNPKRSLIIMASVSVGLWSGIFLMAFYNGLIEQRVKSAIAGELSHLQLHHPEFRNDYDIQYYLPEGRKMLREIAENPEVKAVAGRVVIKGMIATASGSSGITVNGVMADEEQSLTGLKDKITSGVYFNKQKTNEIILSEKLAKKLKIKLNKKTVLTFQDKDGNLASGAFRVCALYRTVNGPYDDNNVFVQIGAVDSLSGITHEFNEIAVLLNANQLLEQNETRLKQTFPELEIKNWMALAPELELTVSVGDQMIYIFMGIILLALAFGIVNTMMMAILERTREIGMLLALGMNKLKIFTMVVWETFFLIMAGCPVGLALAFATIAITQRTGIDLSRYTESFSSFGYASINYPTLTMKQFGTIMMLVVLTAMFSALFPARRALQLKPAEAIKK